MAYMREVMRACHHPGCKATAKYEVFDNRNSTYGKFCAKHAKQLVKNLTAEGK